MYLDHDQPKNLHVNKFLDYAEKAEARDAHFISVELLLADIPWF